MTELRQAIEHAREREGEGKVAGERAHHNANLRGMKSLRKRWRNGGFNVRWMSLMTAVALGLGFARVEAAVGSTCGG